MGKIFDAIEKSKQGPIETDEQVSVTNDTRPPLNEFKPKIKPETNPENRVDPVEIEKEPVEGDIAITDSNLDKNLITYYDPQSFEAEQFKMLKTNLLFPVSGKAPRLIMVTSAVPGEGKSFVSSNLAISIAQNIDEYVLLMDCDIRRPCIHERFGFKDVPGLSEHLIKGIELNSILLKTEIEKLTILPGGNPPPNPSELLSSEKMASLLDDVTHRYDDRYIIVDSPPPHLASEANAIARLVDGVIIVIKAGYTPKEMISDLIELIGKEKVVGVVLNWFKFQSTSKYYGKYKGYHKYQYKKKN